jgi:hypothetical protein
LLNEVKLPICENAVKPENKRKLLIIIDLYILN